MLCGTTWARSKWFRLQKPMMIKLEHRSISKQNSIIRCNRGGCTTTYNNSPTSLLLQNFKKQQQPQHLSSSIILYSNTSSNKRYFWSSSSNKNNNIEENNDNNNIAPQHDFDPLSMPSATAVLKEEDDTYLSPEEIQLKHVLIRYKEVMQHDGNSENGDAAATTNDYSSTGNNEEQIQDVLDNLFDMYHTLGYWEEALGIEQTRCKLYYNDRKKSDDNDRHDENNDQYYDSIHLQGKLYLRQEDFKNSFKLYTKALDYFTLTENRVQRGHVLMSMSGWYYFKQDLQTSLELLLESEPLLESNPTLLVKCLDNIGLIYRCLGDYKLALTKYQEALQLLVGDGRDDAVGSGEKDSATTTNKETRQALCMHIADMYLALDEYDMALQLYEQLFERLSQEPTMENSGTRGVLLHNIATIHVQMGDNEDALEQFNQALYLKIHSGGETNPEVAKTWNSMGRLYATSSSSSLSDRVLQDYGKARECFQQALNIARVNAPDNNEDTDEDVLYALRNLTILDQREQEQQQQQQQDDDDPKAK